MQRGEFNVALEILDGHEIDLNLADGQGAPALYYVVNGPTLDPHVCQVLLAKGANPALKPNPSPQDRNALDYAIETGFHYYTQFRMTAPSNPELYNNFLKTVELLSSVGVIPKESLFEEIQKKKMYYNPGIRNYDQLKVDIASALERGRDTFKLEGPSLKRRKITP